MNIAALFIPEVREHLYFFSRDILLDGTRAAEVLGWRPKDTYEAGIAKTVEWMRSRP
jgi:nucleoside-diphosphate-sugar epimerase